MVSRSITTSALMKDFRRESIARNRANRAAKKEEYEAKLAANANPKPVNKYIQTRKTVDKAYNAKPDQRAATIDAILAEKPWTTQSWFFRDWTQLLQSAQKDGLWQQSLLIFQAMRDNNIYIEKSAFMSVIKTLEGQQKWTAACAMYEKLRRHYSITTLDYLGNQIQPDLPPFELPNLATFLQPQTDSVEELNQFVGLARYYGDTFANSTWHLYIDYVISLKNWELLVKEAYTLMAEQKLCSGVVPTPFAPYRVSVELRKADPNFTLRRQVAYKIINAAEKIGNYSAALDLCLMYRALEPTVDRYPTREFTDILVRRDFMDCTMLKHTQTVAAIQHHFVELRIRRAMENAMAALPQRPVSYNMPENINTNAIPLSSEVADVLLLSDRTFDGSSVKYHGSNTQKLNDLFQRAMHLPIKPIVASQSSLSEIHAVVADLENKPETTTQAGPEMTLIFPREDIINWCDQYSMNISKGAF